MLRNLLTRLRQGHRTMAYPASPPELPLRFRGRPKLDPTKCPVDCTACTDVCPTAAITSGAVPSDLKLDLGRCLFCVECTAACPAEAIVFTTDHRLAVSHTGDLVVDGRNLEIRAQALSKKLKKLLGRSLKLRVVSAGGCNGCESDVNVLNTIGYDLSRFGIQYVASPRHADGLLITGPVTANMRQALVDVYAAIPSPRIVVAVGACAISGGPFAGHAEVRDGAGAVVPVDLFIPGCPPHPVTILDGLLRLIGKLE